MAAAKDTPHFFIVDNAKIGFMTSDSYSDVGTIVGIKKVSDSDKLSALSEVNDLTLGGSLIRFNVGITAADGKKKRRQILCDATKAATARAQLIGKTFGGGKIRTVRIKRDRVLF